MKFKNLVLMSAALLFAGNANALILIGDVGNYDTYVASADPVTYPNPTALPNNSELLEETWIEGVLGFAIDYTKYDAIDGTFWENVTGGLVGDFAIDFLNPSVGIPTPDYFMIKMGNAGGDLFTDYLFQNNSSQQYGFINLSALGNPNDILSISHVSIAINNVPEPGMVALLSIGLLGMVVARRRMKV